MGDSITRTDSVTLDGSVHTTAQTNWPTYLNRSLDISEMWNCAEYGSCFKDIDTEIPRQRISVQINTAIANNRPADIIIVAMGTNDGSSSLGDYDTSMAKTSLELLDRTILYEAIRWAFWTLRTHYPNAICFASTPIQRASKEQPVELIEAITKMANRYNFIIIDALNESGIVREFEVSGAEGDI